MNPSTPQSHLDSPSPLPLPCPFNLHINLHPPLHLTFTFTLIIIPTLFPFPFPLPPGIPHHPSSLGLGLLFSNETTSLVTWATIRWSWGPPEVASCIISMRLANTTTSVLEWEIGQATQILHR